MFDLHCMELEVLYRKLTLTYNNQITYASQKWPKI